MTPRDDLRDELDKTAGLRDWSRDEIDHLADRLADRLSRMRLVDASNAREGVVFTRSCISYDGERLPRGTRVLVIPAEDAS
jgi:hypothetical protein